MNIELLLFTIALVLYIVSAITFIFSITMKKENWENIGFKITLIGFVFHTISIIIRAINAGRIPLSNQFEFASAFAWGIVLTFIFLVWRYEIRSVGVLVMPITFLIMGYASMLNKEIRPLMPALQSMWLPIHIGMAVVSYGAFALSAALGLYYVIQSSRIENGKIDGEDESKLAEKLEIYDFLSYRTVAFGIIMLTLVILTGMIWAKSAWGRYWSWDPKETWSLITWIIYIVYLHLRINRGWQGRKSAWFSILGFISVLFTFMGVNYILPSLHSYF